MGKKLHIIITGESGRGRSLCIHRKSVINIILSTLIITIVFSVAALLNINHYKNDNIALQKHIAVLTNTVGEETGRLNNELTDQQIELATLGEKADRLNNELTDKQIELHYYKGKYKDLEQEKTKMLASAISRLNERSEMMKKIMREVGVVIEIEEDPKHSGGPYISLEDAPDTDISTELLIKTDKYLELFNAIPLACPGPSRITSKYGPRVDPFKKTKAFHAGIDLGGRIGDNIYVTGKGVVRTSLKRECFGNFIVIDHGHGYTTLYAHLSKRLVQKGDKVSRGQIIGLLGNTGRSTGPHLHYEIHKNNKPIDPMKFLQAVNIISAQKTE